MGPQDQQEASDRLRPRPVPGAPVRADPSRPPRDGGDAVRAAPGAARRPAGCSSSAAATAATSCRWPTGCPAARSAAIDLSARAIERARASGAARSASRTSSSSCADLTALPALGEFDYVVAHGVYSWIAPAARDALLAACRAHLAPRRRRVRLLRRPAGRAPARDHAPDAALAPARRRRAGGADRAGAGAAGGDPRGRRGRRRDAPRLAGRRVGARAGRRVDLPRRAGPSTTRRCCSRTSSPTRPPRAALPGRGRRVRDGRRRAARGAAPSDRDRARAVPRLLQGPDVPPDAAVPRGRRAARARPGGRARHARGDAGAARRRDGRPRRVPRPVRGLADHRPRRRQARARRGSATRGRRRCRWPSWATSARWSRRCGAPTPPTSCSSTSGRRRAGHDAVGAPGRQRAGTAPGRRGHARDDAAATRPSTSATSSAGG